VFAAAVPLLSVLTTNQKGAIAEISLTKAALAAGFDVYRPVFEGGRYALIFDSGRELLRVQCKWAPLQGDVVVIRSYSARRNADGLVRRPYAAGEIDALGAYCEKLDRCYLIPFAAINGALQLQLRIRPARNNQHLGVRLASHYELGATIRAATGP
jgi:hypothetical protein